MKKKKPMHTKWNMLKPFTKKLDVYMLLSFKIVALLEGSRGNNLVNPPNLNYSLRFIAFVRKLNFV